ncbi:hypothetical protein CRENBAI_020360 [Crenichthys baileyi]|uniref:Uncharacterized protein n=1 Tax=Crenichthys baileyi TaxID=28760 RepID=A0AAV9QYP5_9TELE
MTKHELFNKENWQKFQSLDAKLVEKYPRRAAVVIGGEGGATKCDSGELNAYVIIFPPAQYVLFCVGLSHKSPVKYMEFPGRNVTKSKNVQEIQSFSLLNAVSWSC